MAIIPRADESQVLNAGSPVPISGTSEARLASDATGKFAETLLAVGIQLNNADQAAKKERARLDAENASNDFSSSLLVLKQKLQTSPEYTVVDSDKMLAKYKEEAYKSASDYAKKAGLSEAARAAFIKDTTAQIAHQSAGFYADAIKDYSDSNKLKVNGLVLSKARGVGIDAQSNLDIIKNGNNILKAVAESDLIITNSNSLTPLEKDQLRIKSKKEIFDAFINGKVQAIDSTANRSQRRAIEDDTVNFVNTFSISGQTSDGTQITDPVFSAEEKKQRIKQVQDARWRLDGRDIQEQNAIEVITKRHTENAYTRTFLEFAKSAQILVKDAETYNIWQAQVKSAIEEGKLKPTDALALNKHVGPKLIQLKMFDPSIGKEVDADTNYRGVFVEKLLAAPDPSEFVDDPYRQKEIYGTSVGTASELILQGDVLAKAMKTNPALRSNIKETAARFQSALTAPGSELLSNEKKRELEQNVMQAKNQLYQSILLNPNLDIKEYSDRVYKSNIEPMVKPPTQATEAILKAQADKLITESVKLKKEGKLTKSLEVEMNRKLLDIAKQLNSAKGNK